jgi:hypothetical protein
MKNLIITSILAILVSAGTIVRSQDLPEEYLGLPGDNLNLYAVMKLFQDSKTLEEFERNLNSKDSMINNLDLNGDGIVDYITVTDYEEGTVHTIVLRAVLGPKEYQDVAVFIVEKKNNNNVQIQLIGDEALYGKDYIIEPRSETPNPGYTGDVGYAYNSTIIIGNDYYGWPLIDYMFMPGYNPWHSSWYWGYWPVWYEPWSPWYWDYYYGYQYQLYPYYYEWYRHWNRPLNPYYRNYFYGSIRARSEQVKHRIHAGDYKQTYSRPDLRTEGENRYASMHLSDTRSTEGQATVERPSRRTSPTQSALTSPASTGTVTERRSVPAVSSGQVSTSGEVRNTDMERRSFTPAANPGENVIKSESNTVSGRRTSQTVTEATSNKTTVSESIPAVSPANEAPSRSSSYAAPVRRSEPVTVQRSEPAKTTAPAPAPAVRSSETRSTETRTSAPVEKGSSNTETRTSRSKRR